MTSLKKFIIIFIVFFFLFLFSMAEEIQKAAKKGDLDTVKILLKKDPKLANSTDKRSSTALHFASHKGHLEIARLLIKKGADIHARDVDGDTPLYWAVQGGKVDVVKLLISKGSKVNEKNKNGDTPLHYAGRFGSIDVADLLLSKGAKLDSKNKNGMTPLFIAAAYGKKECGMFLLSKGADVKVKMDNGWSLLHHAAWGDSDEIIEVLVKKGLSANCKTDYGRTPLHNAALSGNVDVATALIKNGADVNARSNEDWWPLFLAAKRGNKKVVYLLLESGAAVDVKRKKDKRTALHTAAINGFGKVTHLLLSKGADPNIKDYKGYTPIQYAAQYGHKKVAKLLLSNGAKADNLKKKFGNSKLLSKNLDMGKAIVWYLGHSGWAVKTKNHLLVFDYYKGKNRPDEPYLANGNINPDEIKDLNVTVFVSHKHGDHYMPEIFDWKNKVKNITYVMGFKPKEKAEYIYQAPRQKKKINGLKIVTIESNDSGVGFFVIADGVKVFHSGDHANRKRDFSGPFKKEIDFLAEKGLKPDLFFAPVSGCGFGDLVSVKKGVYYTVKKLSPDVVFPMHSGGNESRYIEFAKEAYKSGIQTPMCCSENSGDLFVFNNGKVKNALAFKTQKKSCEKKKKKKKAVSSSQSL